MKYPKAVIRKCNPEVKQDEIVIDICEERFCNVSINDNVIIADGVEIGYLAMSNGLTGNAILLTDRDKFDYKLATIENCLYLIPLKKETV